MKRIASSLLGLSLLGGMLTTMLTVMLTVMLRNPAWAQTAPTMFAESFRQGSMHVNEESFEVKLSPQNATYREPIKDSGGNDRYELTITPRGPEGDTQITSWQVELRDLRHTIYRNVLMAEQKPSEEAKNNLWRLDPNRFGPVPILAKRIVKVEGFYVVMQVKSLHFTPLESPYLDSMAVEFAFANHDPRESQ